MATQAQAVRFRSEPAHSYKSWLPVLLVYSVGAVVLVTLFHFATAFRQFDEARVDAQILNRNLAAAERLTDDLNDSPSSQAMSSALSEFHSQYSEALVDHDVVAPPGASGAPGPSASKLAALLNGGAGPSQLRETAAKLVQELKGNVAAAEGRSSQLASSVSFRAALLGLIVVIGIFGGGVIFLLRSHKLEKLLALRASELEQIDASRRLFFAKASHELRTPVTAMLGEAEVALSHADDLETTRETLRHIAANAKFLGHRIEEMIGLARTADGKLHLDRQRLDLRDVVSNAVQDTRSFADSVEVALDIALPDVPVTVLGDALWLKRAMLAVIENALKFSPMEGRVKITLTARDAFAEVVVADQGPGIVADELPRIFEAYRQTESGRARGGTGLGLAMTRWVAEQHGGSASARNIGGGTSSGCAITIAIKRESVA